MNLDNHTQFALIDTLGMLEEIRALPQQLEKAWKTGEGLPLPQVKEISRIIIAGMGGSAIGADLLSAYIYSDCAIPLFVLRGYSLPAWAQGSDVLVICSSHSGNTEETLTVFEECLQKGCSVMTISTGGKLLELARQHGITHWSFTHAGQPRAAVGFSFGLLLNLFSRLKFIPAQEEALHQAAQAMRALLAEIDADRPVVQNLAKRLAGQAMERFPIVFGAEHLEPVARRWKTQLNEIGKCLAGFEFIPEADHNTLAGLEKPEELLYRIYALFLNSGNYSERNQKRFLLTAQEFMLAGVCIDPVIQKAERRLAEMWKLILLGDMVSFYLSMLYEVDPTPVDMLTNLKNALRN